MASLPLASTLHALDMSSFASSTRSQPFGCNICHKRFTRHENLKRHASVHERARGTKLLTCSKCQVTFSRSDLQHRHMKRKHPEALITRHDSITSQEEAWPVSDSPQNSCVSSPAEPSTSVLFYSRGTPGAETANIHGGTIPRQTDIPYNSLSWQTPSAEGSEYSLTEESRSDAWPHYQINDDGGFDHGQQEHGLQLYFSCFAPSLPFIHQATFDSETATECLLLAMLAIGLHHDDRPEHTDEARRCYDRALTLLDRINDDELKSTADALPVVQTLLLLEVYAILYICGHHSATGLQLHTRMIALSRSARLLQGARRQEKPVGPDLDAVWQDFVFAESHKRTMLAVHQVDALWYHFLSLPRSLSHLEIKHTLPCSATDWDAPTAADWAYSRLTTKAGAATSLKSPLSSTLLYPDMIHQLLTPSTTDNADFTGSDSFGLTSFAHFALSSIREISGWSTITGCVSMDRVEPLKAALLSVAPLSSRGSSSSSRATPPPSSLAFRATWEMAVIDLHIWSLSHTGGVVHSSLDAALEHATQLAIDGDLVLNAEIVATIRPHVDWFLQYLDDDEAESGDPPWVVLFAYKVFLLAWQCLRQGLTDVMDVVIGRGCHDETCGAAIRATRWAQTVMERRGRHKWQYVEVIMKCLDALEAVS